MKKIIAIATVALTVGFGATGAMAQSATATAGASASASSSSSSSVTVTPDRCSQKAAAIQTMKFSGLNMPPMMVWKELKQVCRLRGVAAWVLGNDGEWYAIDKATLAAYKAGEEIRLANGQRIQKP